MKISLKFLLLFFFIIACKTEPDDLVDDPVMNDTDSTVVVIDTMDTEIDTTANDTIFMGLNKINGMSFVSPRDSFPEDMLAPLTAKTNSNWMAISPFALGKMGDPTVSFNASYQWWGERPQGVKTLMDYANGLGMKTMIKPQVWMWDGWVGGFDLESEQDWQKWEEEYERYIMEFAVIAQEKNADLFCIGTEYKIAAVKREEFWRNLIVKIKAVYSGPITYAANWDNYQNIPFWDAVDYIGIDSYFNLIDQKTPVVTDLLKAWEPWLAQIKDVQRTEGKKILFTEFGFMSSDYTAWKNWENEGNLDNLDVNLQGQVNAFEAFFQTFWEEDWVAGGFIWKWFHQYEDRGGPTHKEYTVQRKPAEATVNKWYSK